MALAFFGNGFASITWSLVSSLAPMRLIGLTGGVFNFVGGLGGITVPLVIGYLAQDYGFGPALVYISVVARPGRQKSKPPRRSGRSGASAPGRRPATR